MSECFEAVFPLLREGYRLKICPVGNSMIPFLRGERDDAVLFLPPDGYVYKKNDIILFRTKSGMYVLHRVCRAGGNCVYTLGDGNTAMEGPISREEIVALTEYIIRKGKIIRSDDRRYIFLVSVWRFIRPVRPLVIKSYTATRRSIYWIKYIIRKICSRTNVS